MRQENLRARSKRAEEPNPGSVATRFRYRAVAGIPSPPWEERASTVATKFRYRAVAGIPSPPLEERVRERRPFVSKFICHNTRERRPFAFPFIASQETFIPGHYKNSYDFLKDLTRSLRIEGNK